MKLRNHNNNSLFLHPAQEDVFFDQVRCLDSSKYNVGGYVIIQGAVDLECLEDCIRKVTSSTGVLNVKFEFDSVGPRQLLQGEREIVVPRLDLRESGSAHSDAAAWVSDNINNPVDMYGDRLLEHAFIIVSDEEIWWYIRSHHVVIDGMGYAAYFQHVAKTYTALKHGDGTKLPEQLPDYLNEVALERAFLQSEKYDKGLSYWRERLSDVEFGGFGKKDNVHLSRDASSNRSCYLAEDLVASLKRVAQASGTSMQQIFMLAVGLYSHHIRGVDDVVIGVPVHNRGSRKQRNMVGMLSGVLPFSFDFSSDESVLTGLQLIAGMQKKDYRHHRIPVSHLLRELGLHKSGVERLYDVVFSYDLFDFQLDFNAIPAKVVHVESDYNDLPLQVRLLDYGDFNLELRTHCNLNYFSEDDVGNIQGYLINILEQFETAIDSPLSSLRLCSKDELDLLVHGLGEGGESPGCDVPVFKYIQDVAEINPDKIALVFDTESLSYKELNLRANQLAFRLLSMGVANEAIIGVCLERSLEMFIAVLGVLKAGAAYMPLDPEYPRARLRYMVEDAKPTLIITSTALAPVVAADGEDACESLLFLDGDKSIWDTPQSNVPNVQVNASDLAYIIYTSGSTGNPKGVMLEHGGLTNLALAQSQDFGISKDSRVLQFASFSFDASVSEWATTLSQGATLYLARKDIIKTPKKLSEFVFQNNISHATIPPSLLNELDVNQWNRLTHLIVAGESCDLNHLERWSKGRVFINAYGPTEATVCASLGILSSASSRIHMGRPMAGVQLYIVGKNRNLLPQGGIGELLIGGVGVARGYLNNPELTAERFVAHPFKNDPLNKVYRSGDLVRWNEQGYLEFIGRVDEQIKIHGYRIETGEITARLIKHAAVQQAVVVAKKRSNGLVFLGAYVVLAPDSDKKNMPIILNRYLLEHLPDYMVPSFFIDVNHIPLTGNGKVDKEQLPEPDFRQLQSDYVKPETEIEKVACRVWCEVLGAEKIGRNDNFFQLGGDSLAAMRVANKLYKILALDISVQLLFEYRTLKEFCGQLERLETVEPISLVDADSPLVMSDAQERLWLFDQLEGTSPQYNMPAAFSLRGNFELKVLQKALNALIARHKILRTVYEQDLKQESVFQRILDEVILDVPCVDLTGTAADDLEAAIESGMYREGVKPFDLSRDLMLRAEIMKISDTYHILLLTIHHIAADGWSINLLVDEISALYAAFVRDVEPALNDLSIQYADYAAYGKNAERFKITEGNKDYWIRQLDGMPDVHSIPLDFPRSVKQSFKGALHKSSINSDLLGQFRDVLELNDVTLFMGLNAVLSLTLSHYSNSKDIVIGTPMANRDHPGVEDMIGLFMDMLVLRNQLHDSMTFSDLLGRSKSVFLQANENQITFETLVELMQPPRTSSYSPLFQVMLTLHNSNINTLAFPHVEVSPLHPKQVLAKYDLTLNIEENNSGLELVWEYCTDLFKPETIERMAAHFDLIFCGMFAAPDDNIWSHSVLTALERHEIFERWNKTDVNYSNELCIHQFLSLQAGRTPTGPALVFNDSTLTYQELERRTNAVAAHLLELGVKQETLVGICIERSIDMVVALMAILKAGGAYVPLDPGYPLERLDYMIKDSGLSYILTQNHVAGILPDSIAITHIYMDSFSGADETVPPAGKDNLLPSVNPGQLAYVNYTSGSTGKPKGVMVEHRNLNNFLFAMDDIFAEHLKRHSCSAWLATTSISFDISVLELFWNLKNGRKVIIQSEKPKRDDGQRLSPDPMALSLFYFSSDQKEQPEKNSNTYRLLLEGAKFADENDFSAVWVPERHFHRFGGIYPSPAIAAAAVATSTSRVAIRSGSVVLPLHDPIHIAEQWSMLDNLSDGRVAMGLASGWHPNDFVVCPDNYSQRFQVLKDSIEQVKTLWSGGSVKRKNGVGELCELTILPKPVQSKLPVWITSAGNVETFKYAGSIGANILTHLLGQSLEDLADQIAAYRKSLIEHGYEPGDSTVTVMLHTFVSPDIDFVHQVVREPFRQYLKDSLDLVKPIAEQMNLDMVSNIDEIVDLAYERYFSNAGLFGTPETCARRIIELQKFGIDEVACLIDFGIEEETVLESLPHLNESKNIASRLHRRQRMLNQRESGNLDIGELIQKHEISHIQMTPSFMNELIRDDFNDQALGSLKGILLGGEAWPKDLAAKLATKTDAELFNMYGPTETTVWSSVKRITDAEVRIGGPMANTRFYVLNEFEQPVPIGVFGELYIGGQGVARGYLNLEQLTADRFLTDPFDVNRESLMYRTGDLVRWLPSGELEFAGRIDNQVKVRGFRIELEEVESALLSYPRVTEAVVVARKNHDDDFDLVAYFVALGGAGNVEESGNLSRHLSGIVPDYMLPSVFIPVDSIPLTPNGKVDRKKLPEPNKGSFQKEYVAPRTETEEILCSIFQEMLRVERVGISDSFFLLGGNSLLALRLVNRIRDQLSVDLKVSEFFKNDSIENISMIVERQLVSEKNRRLEEAARNVAEVEW